MQTPPTALRGHRLDSGRRGCHFRRDAGYQHNRALYRKLSHAATWHPLTKST